MIENKEEGWTTILGDPYATTVDPEFWARMRIDGDDVEVNVLVRAMMQQGTIRIPIIRANGRLPEKTVASSLPPAEETLPEIIRKDPGWYRAKICQPCRFKTERTMADIKRLWRPVIGWFYSFENADQDRDGSYPDELGRCPHFERFKDDK
jgi:hypothetical protein